MSFEAIEQSDMTSVVRRFLSSRHPVAILGLKGCSPCAISAAHLKDPDLRFPQDAQIVVRTEAELIWLINWILTGTDSIVLKRSSTLKRALKRMICYCAHVSAILALRRQDCVHEANFQTFGEYSGALKSLSGWEFNLIESQSGHDRRVYRLSRTHSTLIAKISKGGSPVLPELSGLMEVRFVPTGHLRLVIEGNVSWGEFSGQVDLVSPRRKPFRVFKAPTVPLERKRFWEYQVVDERLARAEVAPENTREFLQEAAAEIASGDESVYPVNEIIELLVSSCPDSGSLVKRIRDLRARLWDAPLIAGAVRRSLDSALASEEFAEELVKRPVEVQSEIAELSMSRTQLETLDSFEAPLNFAAY